MALLDGKVALVTGGSRGIGAAIVRCLAREGADVAFTYRSNEEAAKALVKELDAGGRSVRAFQAQVSDLQRAKEVVAAVQETFGTLDILVSNAGVNRDAVIWKMEEEAWDEVIETDLKGTFNYIRSVAPVFRGKKSGRIIAISSINGLRGKFGQTNYSAAKAGVIGLCKAAARELGKYGITVNVICPGLIATEMIRGMPEEFLQKAREEIVLGRIGEPEDVAELVVFLASDRARHITGEVIKVDGGQYI